MVKCFAFEYQCNQDVNVAGRVGSLLEEVIHLADVIQSCAEEPYKVSFSMHFSGE